MPVFRLSRLCCASVGIALFATSASVALAQATSPQPVNANAVLGRLAAAFSGDKVVQTVQLTGTATWHSGSLEDSGNVTLTASAGGSSQMKLSLAETGSRTESQSGAGSDASCQWTGADGVSHAIQSTNCWRSALWFLPALSFQPSILPSYLGTVDLGQSTVGSGDGVYRHLQSQLVFSGFESSFATGVMQQSTTDLGIDPATLLPAVLAYKVQPDSGAQTPIAIQVLYSNYQVVNGVQIPFQIERYVNGSLQLAINVTAAQIN